MPNNWKTYKLGDLISYQKGFAFKSDWFKEKGDLVVRVSDTTSNSINISSCHRIDKEKAITLQRYKLEKDDIVIATVGSWPPNYASVVGKVVKVPKEADGALLNQNAVRLKSIDDSLHSKKYIYYLMKSDSFLRYIVNTAQGSANQASIKLTDIFDFKFNIPFFHEQQSIASILSAIDDKIENNLAINKTLEEMAMALYKHWFVDFGPFQDGEFVESELGMIPKGWEVKRLDSICDKIYSGGTPKTSVKNYWNGEIPWLSSGETRDKYIIKADKNITKLGLEKSSARMAYCEDIVIASAGQGKTRGQTSFLFIDTSINQSVIVLKANKKFINNETLFLDLSSRYDQFRMISDSYSTRGSLTTKLIGSQIKLVLPKIEIQNNFNDLIKDKFSVININLKENQTLTQLRDTLLPQLISGAVRLKEFRE